MKFEKHEKILFEHFGQEILILDIRTNIPYIFNSTAAAIFLSIVAHMDPEEIAVRLCQAYAVDFQSALRDVTHTIDDLRHKGFFIALHE